MRLLKKILKFMFSRLFLVAVMLVVQIALLVTLILYFSSSVFYVYLSLNVLSFFAVVFVVSNDENPSYKLTWIIAILVFPLTGGVFYLMFGNKRMPGKLKKRIDRALEDTRKHMPSNYPADEVLDPDKFNQSRYIYNTSGNPVFGNTSSEYFPSGELMYASMLEELEKAEKFIFMEFFIIKPGIMWDGIFDVLKRKAEAGVEVYFIYDDLGSIKFPRSYNRLIRDAGIKLCVFNPFRPRVSVIMNHRDHRKILVIDGKIAFCGGINIADEYINKYERFGHWKDTGVMLKGEAAWSLSFMFLQMWQFSTGNFFGDFEKYMPANNIQPGDGLVQPFSDSPLDRFNVTETAYLNIIYRAKKYVYITTPYLIIDNEMEYALCTAAEAGIDVRIITPHIPDKWYVHLLTRSHYSRLIKSGVKIYEYTPGFIHSKMFLSDDEICMVGTCNMDFRSFYLHFECSVVFYASTLIAKVKKDMLDCQRISQAVTLEQAQSIAWYMRVVRSFLKLLAPLM